MVELSSIQNTFLEPLLVLTSRCVRIMDLSSLKVWKTVGCPTDISLMTFGFAGSAGDTAELSFVEQEYSDFWFSHLVHRDHQVVVPVVVHVACDGAIDFLVLERIEVDRLGDFELFCLRKILLPFLLSKSCILIFVPTALVVAKSMLHQTGRTRCRY